MKRVLALSAMLLSSSALSSHTRDIQSDELNTLNWLLDCRAELAEAIQSGEWIGSGTFTSDRSASSFTYNFFRRDGFVNTTPSGTLTVTRIPRENPELDAPAIEVQCSYVPAVEPAR